jgi:cyclomaltodextrinase / maltogenic alpha-amylase / neopullulanase
MAIDTPEWVKHAIFYQIFPDRFARSPRVQPPPGVQYKPWGSPPEVQGFQGGDLLGIMEHLDDLQALGVTALSRKPIFASAANHRDHPYDDCQVDPLLGGHAAFRELLDAAHGRGMRVMLDGVFNHASRGFWAFHHILENGVNSPYLDWFRIRGWPLRPYGSDAQHPANYDAWWNLPALPKFNHRHAGVRAYLLEVARHWTAFGIDGWRLDVPTEIEDPTFWPAFRQVVKGINPDAYLCGELWRPAPPWVQGDRFDGLMNDPFSRAVLGYCGAATLRPDYRPGGHALEPLTAEGFARQIDTWLALYPWAVTCAQLNLLDSHDTARALWIVGEDRSALRLGVLCQMTMPGAPCLYYGDEIGLSSGPAPYCRAAFPWQAPQARDRELLAFYRQALALRHRYPVLRTGTFQTLSARGAVYAFGRTLPTQAAVVVFNVGTAPVTLDLPLGGGDMRGSASRPCGAWAIRRAAADTARRDDRSPPGGHRHQRSRRHGIPAGYTEQGEGVGHDRPDGAPVSRARTRAWRACGPHEGLRPGRWSRHDPPAVRPRSSPTRVLLTREVPSTAQGCGDLPRSPARTDRCAPAWSSGSPRRRRLPRLGLNLQAETDRLLRPSGGDAP